MQYAKAKGLMMFRRNVGGAKLQGGQFVRFAEAGQSDLYGWRPKRLHYELEIKRPGGRVSEAQFDWIEKVRDSGAIAVWVDSVEDGMKWVDEWFVWHGSLSSDYFEPASYENGFLSETEASEFARKLYDEIGYVEGGIINIDQQAQEESLVREIKFLTERLNNLRVTGNQFPAHHP